MARAHLRAALCLFAAAAVVFFADRLTKVWAEGRLPGDPIEVVPGVLTFRFATNPGGAFSLGQDWPWFFVAATVIVSVLIVATAFRHTSVVTAVALGLVLGGALGNLADRLTRGEGLPVTWSTSSTCRSGPSSTSPTPRSSSGRCCSRSGRSSGTDRGSPRGSAVTGRAAGAGRRWALTSSSASPAGSMPWCARLTGLPRADVQRAIADGRVLVDGSDRPKSYRLHGGERLEVRRGRARAARRRGARRAGPRRGRRPRGGREACRRDHAPHGAATQRHAREPAARHGPAAVFGGG